MITARMTNITEIPRNKKRLTVNGQVWEVRESFFGNLYKYQIYDGREMLKAEIKTNMLKGLITPCQNIYIGGEKITEIKRKISLDIKYVLSRVPYSITVDMNTDEIQVIRNGTVCMFVKKERDYQGKNEYYMKIFDEENYLFHLCIIVAIDMSNRQLTRSMH